ncbi:hypothetical protein RQP46_003029 [Phenoliferia psychrophenolica]
MGFWHHHHFELPFNPYAVPHTGGAFSQGISGGTVNSAASTAAREAIGAGQAAFAHAPFPAGGGVPPPHMPHVHAPQPYGTYPQVNNASMHRYGCRGPRLFPLLLLGGAGVWGYHHMKHQVWELSDEVKSLKHIVFSQAQRETVEMPLPEPVAVPDTKRRRTWERRWGDRGENMAKISVVQDKLV